MKKMKKINKTTVSMTRNNLASTMKMETKSSVTKNTEMNNMARKVKMIMEDQPRNNKMEMIVPTQRNN